MYISNFRQKIIGVFLLIITSVVFGQTIDLTSTNSDSSYLDVIASSSSTNLSFNSNIFSSINRSNSNYSGNSITSSSFEQIATTASGRVALAVANPNYPVTPGDIYTLTYVTAGGLQRDSLVVNSNEEVSITHLGQIEANGMSYLELQKEVLSRVNDAYPLSTPRLEIQQTGAFPVSYRGEVVQSGVYYAWGLSKLSALVQSVATNYTSIRKVTLVKSDGKSYEYDLYKALLEGVISENPRLEPGDSVILERASIRVILDGDVFNPSNYQTLQNETVQDLINKYGGGLLDTADTNRIELTRLVDIGDKAAEKEVYPLDEIRNLSLKNYDTVYVPTKQETLPNVFFEGAIMIDSKSVSDYNNTVRVRYQYYPGETLESAVKNMKDRLGQTASLKDAYILRGNETFGVDLNQYIGSSKATQKIILHENDTIVIPFRQYFVLVGGAVNAPGQIPYIPNKTWRYYISMAGGYVPFQNMFNSMDIIDSNNNIKKKSEVIEPGDKIFVKANHPLFTLNTFSTTVTAIATIITSYITISNFIK